MGTGLYDFFLNVFTDSKYTHSDWKGRHFIDRHWREFEELISVLYNDMGYKTSLQRGKRDGGVDIIARETSRIPLLNPPTIAIQVKNWNKKIPEPKVRDMYGVQCGGHRHSNIDDFDKSVLVTSLGNSGQISGFTQGARQFAESNGVELIDGEKLLELLNNSNLEPLTIGKKSGGKWHLREPPCCGWAKNFQKDQLFDKKEERIFDRKAKRVVVSSSGPSITMDNLCKACMKSRLK